MTSCNARRTPTQPPPHNLPIQTPSKCKPPPIHIRTNHQKIAGSFTETELGTINFPEISTPTLERVCQYFHYKLRHQAAPARSVPEFKVRPEEALELLMASNFLDT